MVETVDFISYSDLFKKENSKLCHNSFKPQMESLSKNFLFKNISMWTLALLKNISMWTLALACNE